MNNVYANNVPTAAGTTSTIEVASKVVMGTLSVGNGSTLIVAPYADGTIADVPYQLTLGATSLLGTAADTDTLTVTKNGLGMGTLVLGDIGPNSANLLKDGNGTLILTGAIGYTGTTTINAGTLDIESGTTVQLTTISGAGNLIVGATASTTILTATSISVNSLSIGTAPPVSASAVPEPNTIALLTIAAIAVGVTFYRRK